VAIAETKFVQIPLQVRLADTVIGAGHAAFQNREKSLNSVGMYEAANILPRAMVDFVSQETVGCLVGGVIGVRKDDGSIGDLTAHDSSEISAVDGRDMIGAHRTVALYEGKDGGLIFSWAASRSPLVGVLVFLQTTNPSVVNLDSFAFATNRPGA